MKFYMCYLCFLITLISFNTLTFAEDEHTYQVGFKQFPKLFINKVTPVPSLALSLHKGQIFLIESKENILVLEFTKNTNKSAQYQYRLFSKLHGDEKIGTGEVFEKYHRERKEDSVLVTDAGSQLQISKKDIKLEWSAGGPEVCYIYFNPQKYTFATLNSDAFDKIQFKKK